MSGARALLAVALLAQACSYDLAALRGVDAAVDRPRPVDLGPRTDLGPTMDVPVDRPGPTDGGPDAGARSGSCELDGGTVVSLAPPVPPARPTSDAGVTLAYALVQNNLQNALGLALPTGTVDGGVLTGCSTVDGMRTPPTRIYRYQVVEGGSVTATTNTQHCTPFDTRVYALWSCKEQDLANPVVCGDDLSDSADTSRCPSCGTVADAGGACAPLLSTIETPPSQVLRRGDVVYFAVTGFNINPGVFPHRLWVGENAARIEAFPAMPDAPVVNRCVCQDSTPAARTVFFPHPVPEESFPSPVNTMPATSSFLGVRSALPTGMYSGVSMQFRVLRATIPNVPGCPRDTVRAVFDLLVGGSIVTTFSIRGDIASATTFTVPYTAFAPTLLTSVAAGMALQLRMREARPQPACLDLVLDPVPGANAVTLYGGP